jgi:iron complex outermembrane receptor protein
MSHKDYYADWNQGAALGDSTFNIYDPQYGTIPPLEIPQWDRSLDVRERGVRYNNSYTGIYIQDEIGFFNNSLRLTLAGRYTTNSYLNPYSGSSKDGKFTPRTGLSWSITPQIVTYAVYDQIFLANPGTDWQGNNFDPITGENLEWGLKKDWFGGKWNSTVALYRITKNNILTADLEHPDPESGQYIYSTQLGQQQVKGVELDIRGEIVENLEVILNYAYTDARITEDTDPEVIGNRVPGATEHIQNAWINYGISRGVLNGLRFSLGYQFQAGRSSWFIFDNSQNSLPDYFRWDGGLGYQTDRFNIHLIVNNILNDYLYSGAPYGDMFYWQTEPPRNFRLTIDYSF